MKKRTLLILLTIVICTLTTSGFAAESKTSIRYFVPGQYDLIEGEIKLCGEGEFHLTPDGSRLWLGPYYSFRTTKGTDNANGGFPNDKGCVYNSVSDFNVKGQQTIFTDTTTLLCGKTERQVVTNTAVITKHRITLDQTSTVDLVTNPQGGGSPHHCAWRAAK